eukprot:TRINITY_DN94226_c0_g1_i1.p1 TRINITY_DN94226_c0_g1~~TRINITY_DN94226_c0_g1_i1.p1  ORF type:complete len:503 (-),score=91.14 TRINITY_DN94226_c0_g1_i1:469-1908(-)
MTVFSIALVAPLFFGLVLAVQEEKKNFTVLSLPVRLRYGQVFNRYQMFQPLPEEIVSRYANSSIAITGFDVDMVRIRADGSEEKVKLDDHYLHHYALSIGSENIMSKIDQKAAEDKMFARMLRGCHAMTGVGVHAFLDELEKLGHNHDELSVFGSAAGAEYRHNPQRFEAPFRALIKKPQVWSPLLHIINTQEWTHTGGSQDIPYSPLLECPCTPQRKINVSAGTIDGKAADPPIKCSQEFAATGNPSCHLSTYVGGWRCCEDGVFLVDTDEECKNSDCSEKPVDEVHMKFTFFYEDPEPATRPIESAACCDVTSSIQGNENIEYDIPNCPEGTPAADCIHVAESIQPIGYFGSNPMSPNNKYQGSDLVDLVFAAPHLHVAAKSIELIDHVTNKTICEVHVTPRNDGGLLYGHGSTPGDENGYLVGLETCRWTGATAPRFRRDHPMRSRAIYNATHYHTGVMSLWLMNVAAVPSTDVLI